MIDAFITRAIARNLRVPEWSGLPPVMVEVAMPKGPIYKDRDAAPDPRKVWTSRDTYRMAAPPTYAGSP